MTKIRFAIHRIGSVARGRTWVVVCESTHPEVTTERTRCAISYPRDEEEEKVAEMLMVGVPAVPTLSCSSTRMGGVDLVIPKPILHPIDDVQVVEMDATLGMAPGAIGGHRGEVHSTIGVETDHALASI